MNSTSGISIQQLFNQRGFVHVADDVLLKELQQNSDFEWFKRSWNDLPLDEDLRDRGKYRFRRYSVFNIKDNKLTQLPIEPHYQSLEYNEENGGYYRHFSELQPAIAESSILRELIQWNVSLISKGVQKDWRVQCHQFRICATDIEAGKPSPEGIHQDGADYVSIVFLQRKNVLGASNTIHNQSGDVIYEATLTKSGEAILIDDKRYWHGVTNVYQDDKGLESYRDVLVLTFHKP